MKNIAEHPESIRVIAERLLTKAVGTEAFYEAPQCRDGCPTSPVSHVVYRVAPTVFLPEEKQQALCLTLEQQTKENPLHFGAKEFNSVPELNDWIMQFSQGRGDDGKRLYEQCGGNCSPRYTFSIAQDGEKLKVSTDVLCGFARDKKSDQYAVSTVIRWQCGKD